MAGNDSAKGNEREMNDLVRTEHLTRRGAIEPVQQ